MESVWRQTGIKPKELDEVHELPDSCSLAWSVFLRLNRKRQSSGFGVNPISDQEIYSHCKLRGVELEEWEVDLIDEFDAIVLGIYAKKQEAESRKASKK